MLITVAICTWNRASLLDETLAALAKLDVPDGVDWEVLVVDNGSSDDTPAVLERHRASLPLRSVVEPERGHSHARNRAVACARGDLLLWTDDDVVVDEHWLAAYAATAAARPEVDFFGGPIEPRFDGVPPCWLVAALPVIETAFALRDFGPEPFDFDAARLPLGANFAVRTHVQRSHAYDPRLGRVGSQLLSGDESDVLRRLVAEGRRGAWVPGARVRHHVGAERMTLDWLRRFFRGIGRSDVVARGEERLPAATRWARLLLCAAKGGIKGARYRLRRHWSPPLAWARDLRDSNIHWGRYDAYRAIGARACDRADRQERRGSARGLPIGSARREGDAGEHGRAAERFDRTDRLAEE